MLHCNKSNNTHTLNGTNETNEMKIKKKKMFCIHKGNKKNVSSHAIKVYIE